MDGVEGIKLYVVNNVRNVTENMFCLHSSRWTNFCLAPVVQS